MRERGLKPPVLRVAIRAPVNPTEDVARVRAAITSLFPDAEVKESPGHLDAEATDLSRLRELIRSERIPDSARGVMLSGLSTDGLRTRFLLGKQAAAAGRAHFGPLRSPLGDLEVTFEGTEPFEVETAVYRIEHDTTVAVELAEVPPALRPATA
jgi:predicted RNA binding protein with dsRBD fold (UPF0201 family)